MAATDYVGEAIQAFWLAAALPMCPVCHHDYYPFNPYAQVPWQAYFVKHWNETHAGRSCSSRQSYGNLPYIPMRRDRRWRYLSHLCGVQACFQHLIPYVATRPDGAARYLNKHMVYRHTAPSRMPAVPHQTHAKSNSQPAPPIQTARIVEQPPSKLRKPEPGYFDPSLPSQRAKTTRSKLQKTQGKSLSPEPVYHPASTAAASHAHFPARPGPSTSYSAAATPPILQPPDRSPHSKESLVQQTERSPNNDLRGPSPTQSFLENAYNPPSRRNSRDRPPTPLESGKERSNRPMNEPLRPPSRGLRWHPTPDESNHTEGGVHIIGPSRSHPVSGGRAPYPRHSPRRVEHTKSYFKPQAGWGAPSAGVKKGSVQHAKAVEGINLEYSTHPPQDPGLNSSEFPKPMSREPTPDAMKQNTGRKSDHRHREEAPNRIQLGKRLRQGVPKSAAMRALYPGPVGEDTPAGVKGLYRSRYR